MDDQVVKLLCCGVLFMLTSLLRNHIELYDQGVSDYAKTKMVGVMVTVVALTTTAFILPMLNEKAEFPYLTGMLMLLKVI
jgi:hypothetical protein